MESPNPKLLLASDKKTIAAVLSKDLGRNPLAIKTVSFHHLTLSLEKETPDCLVLLTESEKVDNALIEEIKQFDDNLPIIMVSPAKKIEEAIRLMKEGLYDYFGAPYDCSKLWLAIQNASRLYRLTRRIFLLENQLGAQTKLDQIIGSAPSMQTIYQIIKNVAQTNATVLITGESGTGKELVAKAIHRLGKRVSRRFIDINCGAIPSQLLENELFGHERGSFTSADSRYIGCCERADGGTLFLDEISEMDLSLQVKILRFLQERQFLRIGGNEPIKVDVGIIAATNKDLSQCVAKGTFREDLFYRLNVVMIPIPPLRERQEDIPLLAKHFLEKYSHKNEKLFLDFTAEAMSALIEYRWPGNVRELENTIERGVVLHNETKIKLSHLPSHFYPLKKKKENVAERTVLTLSSKIFSSKKVLPLTLVERYAIEQALEICTGNITLAAKRLKIGQATLYRKLRRYGIRA